MNEPVFRRESHYAWLAFAIALCHVLFMSYVFPKSWWETTYAMVFIQKMASIIPALNNLMQHSPPYTNFWGMFYASFWVISPAFFLLGFGSTFFMRNEKNKILMLASYSRYIGMISILLLGIGFFWMFPSVGDFPNPLFNQTSNSGVIRITAWGIVAGVIYVFGVVLGALYRKVIFHTIDRGEIK